MTILEIMQMANEDYALEGRTPYDINNGFCTDWADTVMENLDDIAPTEIWETIWDFADAIHCFIRINGKFYDAECLNGVDDHMNLPLFINNKYEKRQPVWRICSNSLFVDNGGESYRDITAKEIAEIE